MLLVKTHIAASSIAGTGLFASEFIPKGTKIWHFEYLFDNKISEYVFRKLPQIAKEYIINFCYMENGCYILCTDNAKYTNHSLTPNCSDGFAISDIQEGEEITENYYEYDELASTKLK